MLKVVVKGSLACPAVFCDYCGRSIDSASEGTYEWVMDEDWAPGDVFFTHRGCSRLFERAHPLPLGQTWGASPLGVFPLYLGNNLSVEWQEAQREAQSRSA
jgi:hypothetical protein